MKGVYKYKGYTIARGDYTNTAYNRLDRWYVEPVNSKVVDRTGAGYRTLADAKEEIRRRVR